MPAPSEPTTIRDARPDDAEAVARIYNHYVRETVVTFEEQEIDAPEMAARIAGVQSLPLPWLVADQAGKLVGYAYATKWRPRTAYRFSAEITVYVDPAHTGHAVGSSLYGQLLPRLREAGVHAVMGGIALPNDPSIALHEKFGLQQVAWFRQVGQKFGRWIDVGYWQKLL